MKGILLVNMGSPSSEKEMRTFLYRMFSDHHIIPLPYLLQQFVALPTPSAIQDKKSWKKYLLIGGSPLLISDKNLANNLRQELGSDVTVRIAFSYSVRE